jgi:hypothetical protein
MLIYRGSREAVEFINKKIEEQGKKKKEGKRLKENKELRKEEGK